MFLLVKVIILFPPSGDGDLDGGVSGPLVGGLVEPAALSGTAEERTGAHAVRWVQTHSDRTEQCYHSRVCESNFVFPPQCSNVPSSWFTVRTS